MPHPANLTTALEVEKIIRDRNATPATIAVLEGKIHIGMLHRPTFLHSCSLHFLSWRLIDEPGLGLTEKELEFLAVTGPKAHKTSRRDFPFVLSHGIPGATTVSGTMMAAHIAGIKIFVTGGIGFFLLALMPSLLPYPTLPLFPKEGFIAEGRFLWMSVLI